MDFSELILTVIINFIAKFFCLYYNRSYNMQIRCAGKLIIWFCANNLYTNKVFAFLFTFIQCLPL